MAARVQGRCLFKRDLFTIFVSVEHHQKPDPPAAFIGIPHSILLTLISLRAGTSYSDNVLVDRFERYYGQSVRPVTE